MNKGISLYPGMGYGTAEVQDYLRRARLAGFSRLFTSLHIPEADPQALLDEFHYITAAAVRQGFSVTADISPRTFRLLEASPADSAVFTEAGLHALRLDFGFSVEEIAAWTHSGLMIEVNASTVDKSVLDALRQAGADFNNLQACHNYYPRPETGLSYELFSERSRLFRANSIPVTAFIPSLRNPRGPLKAGLPTLERHRNMNPLQAAKHLIWDQQVDAVIIGDPFASQEEIVAVGAIDEAVVELQVAVQTGLSALEEKILLAQHTNRTDPGEWVIRSATARTLATEPISADRTYRRLVGSVTVDNAGYLRYAGELQLVRRDLPADSRVNVTARVIEKERFLIDLIRPGMQFRFKPVN